SIPRIFHNLFTNFTLPMAIMIQAVGTRLVDISRMGMTDCKVEPDDKSSDKGSFWEQTLSLLGQAEHPEKLLSKPNSNGISTDQTPVDQGKDLKHVLPNVVLVQSDNISIPREDTNRPNAAGIEIVRDPNKKPTIVDTKAYKPTGWPSEV